MIDQSAPDHVIACRWVGLIEDATGPGQMENMWGGPNVDVGHALGDVGNTFGELVYDSFLELKLRHQVSHFIPHPLLSMDRVLLLLLTLLHHGCNVLVLKLPGLSESNSACAWHLLYANLGSHSELPWCTRWRSASRELASRLGDD